MTVIRGPASYAGRQYRWRNGRKAERPCRDVVHDHFQASDPLVGVPPPSDSPMRPQ